MEQVTRSVTRWRCTVSEWLEGPQEGQHWPPDEIDLSELRPEHRWMVIGFAEGLKAARRGELDMNYLDRLASGSD